ncbi:MULTISPECIES: SDR family NAD(P)-dependent oxidoreductase [Microbacterium]|uniref:SDR family NAD(P)-dependent oxidoreductase n=1 Tax=Microbacterium aquimaris TaxID=459816 RepID=A0ABU5N2S9_9MICO|nr:MULTISPECIES: SDR family NAD(P)-dependent oxidoreductase [Microbacterium]MDZ8160383.1 SDR family NAD(P)-dependent oxidoreductase [Microbacterium aquimaris]MDZ8200375.1 SDR family NAD(P)-dependent oxidoreductase [Microbacterium sp. SSW1-59]
MTIDLTGRRAIVTGSGAGIGAAIAKTLADAGADVVIHYANSEAGATAVSESIVAAGRRSIALRADLTDSSAADAFIGEAVEFLGGLDILVNNAGHLVGRAPLAETTDERWHQIMDVNATSAFFATRPALPHLTASEHGRIVMMSSLASENGGGAGSVVYATSKAATIGFTRALAKEIASTSVTVNAVAPGFIGDTPFHDTFTPAEAQKNIVSGIPLGRAGTPQDVADVALFLASDLSSYVTGQVVDINGGLNFR